jgi:acylphosphatase
MALESLHLIVKGRVQGVGFRYYVLTRARSLSINGYARNLADGSVEVYAEGEPSDLNEFLDDLKRGPDHADVSGVEITMGAARHQVHGFYIR